MIREIRPKRILEVGTLVGYSTIMMAKELEEDAEIITIEIDEDEAELARKNIVRAEVKPGVRVLVGDALKIIPKLEGVFDMVFIDADKSEYHEYLRLVEGHLHAGSVIVADNTKMSTRSMRRYLDRVRDSGKYRSRFERVNWVGMEVSVRL